MISVLEFASSTDRTLADLRARGWTRSAKDSSCARALLRGSVPSLSGQVRCRQPGVPLPPGAVQRRPRPAPAALEEIRMARIVSRTRREDEEFRASGSRGDDSSTPPGSDAGEGAVRRCRGPRAMRVQQRESVQAAPTPPPPQQGPVGSLVMHLWADSHSRYGPCE